MTNNTYMADHKGFSLLEMTIVLIIISVLAAAAIPSLTQSFLNNAGEKTSLDMSAIEEGARAYYIANGSWPAAINVLQTANYLPAGWNAANPWGNAYTITVNGPIFSVSTQVANGAQIAVTSRLPVSTVVGNTVMSSIPPPGASSIGFGAAIPINNNINYYANTDGFVVGWGAMTNGAQLAIVSDSNPIPSTVMGNTWANSSTGTNGGYGGGTSLIVPVRKGNYYRATGTGDSFLDLWFVPIGV